MPSPRVLGVLFATILFQLLLTTQAEARCRAGFTAVWPAASSTLVPDAEIVLQGYGNAADSVQQVASRNPMLVSRRGDRVPLRVVMVQQGDRGLTQAVLRVERGLRVRSVYQLRIGGRMRRDLQGNRAQWTVAPTPDGTVSWYAAPRAATPESIPYGCGPEEAIPVVSDVSTPSPVRYRVWLWRDGTDPSTARVFDIMPPTHDRSLRIGHGMCNGAFDPPSGTRVHFRLALMDPTGRETPAPGPALTAIFP